MIQKLKRFFIFLLKIVSGYYLWREIILLIRRRHSKLYGKQLYIKEFFDWDGRYMHTIRLSTKFTFIILSVVVITYVFLSNLTPFGITQVYSLEEKDPQLSSLSPNDRVAKISTSPVTVYKQIGDLIYFSTNMPFHFDNATVKITYQNKNPDQELQIGFKDQEDYHFHTHLIDTPLLNTLDWPKIGEGPVLYQKNPTYTSVTDFLAHPPKDAIIGVYNLNPDTIPQFQTTLSDYKPAKTETVIDTPLRGSHTLYAYLKNEKFIMSITKQDLNWYDGADPLTITIYKDGDQVDQETIPDDGVDDSSHKTMPEQTLTIKNPGPDLPEPGIYKVVLSGGGDTIIKRITTNLHKIVFASPLYVANNADVYHPVVASTSATTLFTNALALTAQTYHPQAIQTLQVGKEALKLPAPQEEEAMVPQEDLPEVTIPKSDVVLKGLTGYFAFNKDAFFTPTPYHLLSLDQPDDLDFVDYVLADYTPPLQSNGWKVATYTFDLKNAVVQDGKLSWVIQAPGLKENNRAILIKNIQVELDKKPLVSSKWQIAYGL